MEPGAVQASGRLARAHEVPGKVTLRDECRLCHIGIGRAYTGQRIILLVVAGRHVRVLTEGGELRQLKLDPKRTYQPQEQSEELPACLRCPDTYVSDVLRHHKRGVPTKPDYPGAKGDLSKPFSHAIALDLPHFCRRN
jgi:hypothetical protein